MEDQRTGSDSRIVAANAAADEAHAIKESKMNRLQQMSSINIRQRTQNEEIESSKNKKVEFARTVDMNRKMIEEITGQIKQISSRCDGFEPKFRELDFKLKEAFSKIDANKLTASSELKTEMDDLNTKLRQSDEQRLQGVQELEKIINLRDKKLSQAISNEVNEEANARMLIANDCTRLSEHLKEVKIGLTEDISRLQGTLASAQSRNQQEFVDLKELVSAEKATRERALVATKNDFQLRQVEARQVLEAKCEDVLKEHKAGYAQLTALLDHSRTESEKQAVRISAMVEGIEKKQVQRIEVVDATVQKRVNDIMETIDSLNRNMSSAVSELQISLADDRNERIAEIGKVREDFAAEHLQREKDETAIITMLETCMGQARDQF